MDKAKIENYKGNKEACFKYIYEAYEIWNKYKDENMSLFSHIIEKLLPMAYTT